MHIMCRLLLGVGGQQNCDLGGEVSVCRDFRHTADDERLRQIKSDIPSFKLLEVIRKIYK